MSQVRLSALAHEPRAALAALKAILAPQRTSSRLEVSGRTRPIAATTEGDRVTSGTFLDLENGATTDVAAAFVVDATETGELLPLIEAEYVTGDESHHDTGEPHASESADRSICR